MAPVLDTINVADMKDYGRDCHARWGYRNRLRSLRARTTASSFDQLQEGHTTEVISDGEYLLRNDFSTLDLCFQI